MLEPCRIAWLPQFVAHYRGLGVERFLLSLQLEPNAAPAEKERHRTKFKQTLAALDIDEAHYWEQPFDSIGAAAHNRALQQQKISPGDWVLWCDSDEFRCTRSRCAISSASAKQRAWTSSTVRSSTAWRRI
jgi:hypothetical protein